MSYQVKAFQSEYAPQVASMVGRNFLEVNIKDYPLDIMKKMAQEHDANSILRTASYAHMYVVFDGQLLVGCGGISPFWGSETESILLTIFTLPEYHGKGVGRLIMSTLERDPYFLRADRVEIPASITAVPFYQKFGYTYKNGERILNEEGNIRLEKKRKI